MIIHKEIAIKPLENGDCAKKTLERFYVQNCFKNHLKSINKPDDTYDVSSPNYKYHITSQVIENTDGLFTLPQLYCIYTASNLGLYDWETDYTEMIEFKTNAIEYIDEMAEYYNDLGDTEIFLKNISDLNPIIFTVLNDLLYESDTFDEDYCYGIRYAKISDDENECQTELEELVWTYNALERIGAVCKKFYHIDDRVAALINEGYEIKPCWVGSGGVNSTFYMYKKKEIRIQVAASKYKGNGNSRSKSALCVVIPYPTFLRRNCIKYCD